MKGKKKSLSVNERLYSVVTFYRNKKTAIGRETISRKVLNYATLKGTKINFSRIEKKKVIIYSYKIYTPLKEESWKNDIEKIHDRILNRAYRNKAEAITTSLQKFNGKVIDYYKGTLTGDRSKAAKQFAVKISEVKGKSIKDMITAAKNRFIRNPNNIDGMIPMFEKLRYMGYTISNVKETERKRKVHKR